MFSTAGARFAALVNGIVGGALAIVIGLFVILFGGIMDVLDASNGNSMAASGALALLFGLAAIGISLLFLLPWGRPAVVLMALDLAAMIWAFGRVGAWELGLVPVLPLAFAVLLGLAAKPAEREPG